jgi:multiple sugar transport system permease protein
MSKLQAPELCSGNIVGDDERTPSQRRMERSPQFAGRVTFHKPWIVGFFLFLVYPVFSNFHLGMTEYSRFGAPEWIGLQNYQELFHDSLFWTSLYNTFYYVILAVPLGVAVAIVLALAMNQKVREVSLYRALLYN